MSRFYLDYRVLCQANLAVLRDFSLDLVGTMSDPYGETADWGAAIVFPEDGLPVCTVPLLQRLEDIRELPSPEPTSGRRMSNRLHALRFYRDHERGEVPILGWVEGALAEAANLSGVSRLMVDLYDNPEPLEEVLDFSRHKDVKTLMVYRDRARDVQGRIAALVADDVMVRNGSDGV